MEIIQKNCLDLHMVADTPKNMKMSWFRPHWRRTAHLMIGLDDLCQTHEIHQATSGARDGLDDV